MGFKIIDLYRILNTIYHVYQNKKYNLNENEIVVPLFKEPEICNKLSFIELGEQEFKIWDFKNKLLKQFLKSKPRKYNNKTVFPNGRIGLYSMDYLKTIFKNVVSTDVITTCPETINLDLGFELKTQSFSQKFDILNNNGTTEHVGEFPKNKKTDTYNPQYWAFKNIHDLVNKNGLMFHSVPYKGMKHGAYNYEPIFFEELAQKCGYKTIYSYIEQRGKLKHSAACLLKINDDSFISEEIFNKLPGIYLRKL